MASIWSDESRFEIWLEVEGLALEQMVREGLAPEQAIIDYRHKATFDTERVLELEQTLKHDVIAFLSNVAESVGPNSRFVHRGMTSSDLLDTSYAVQLKRSGELLLAGIDKVMLAIKTQADKHRYTPCIGRSHGIHAEPTTFGVKLISWYAEMKRSRARLVTAIHEVAVGKIAGAVGTYAGLPPSIEAFVMEKLGLRAEDVPSQIVHRDRHAAFFSALAVIASSIERFSTEVRHLQRTEVREAEERFTAGQKGSSAMPHKRNPILTENLCGLARLVRGNCVAALENVALWHERDISHSSVERVISPDACITLDFMLHRLSAVVEGLVVYPDRMLENLEMTRGLVFSGTLLIALVDHGIVREDAYALVQKHALEAWDGGATLKERVLSDPTITKAVPASKIEEVFDLKRHMKHVDFIFERALKD
jgi:adenylosuccinate lyase